jgi:hypothetical protein
VEAVLVETWQIVALVFLILLPMALMLDFWGSERLTFRGRPIARDWRRQVEHPPSHDEGH